MSITLATPTPTAPPTGCLGQASPQGLDGFLRLAQLKLQHCHSLVPVATTTIVRIACQLQRVQTRLA